MEKVIDFIQNTNWFHALVIILLMLDDWRRIRIIKIKDGVIDNLCKDNHNLLKGRADLVWKRMQNDLGDDFKPTRWISFTEKPPKKKKPVLICDSNYENAQVCIYTAGFWNYAGDMAYWAPMPKEIEK